MRPTVLLHDSQETLFTVAAMFATVIAGHSVTAPPTAAARPTVDQVIRWKRTLLQIIRTPGAQPATVHPARNLAIMTSVRYTAALHEVQRLGEMHSAARADQTHVANVWAAPIQNYWNEIAQTAAPELLGSAERGGFEPDLRRGARQARPDLRQRTGRDVRTACSATTFKLAGRWV
jgi:hypothetical protein